MTKRMLHFLSAAVLCLLAYCAYADGLKGIAPGSAPKRKKIQGIGAPEPSFGKISKPSRQDPPKFEPLKQSKQKQTDFPESFQSGELKPGKKDKNALGAAHPIPLTSSKPENPSTRPVMSIPDLAKPDSRPFRNKPEKPAVDSNSDFLNLQRPARSANDRRGDVIQSQIARPETSPGDRVGRPIKNVNNINVTINRRPAWVNIDNNRYTTINNRWNSAIINRAARPGEGLYDWMDYHRDRQDHWRYWGDNVRHHWRHTRNDWFRDQWWDRHGHQYAAWHYYHTFDRHPWRYWWDRPDWVRVARWFVWTSTVRNWEKPVYYDYGNGGNVVYRDHAVYIGGQEVASEEDFTMSAVELATAPPPASEQQAAAAEWLPLGTFAISAHEKDEDPSRVVQLAVTKDGIIGGTLVNLDTDEAESIQGRVDSETQRAAFRIGSHVDIVVETGIYNLTQAECPVLVHFGADKVETYVLVRLDYSEDNPLG